jgi:opacity protein-like surface antigen
METMRSVVVLTVGVLALASAAGAQTRPGASDTEHGYVEGVIQSAFGNVTSQSFGVELGVTIRPNLQLFVEGGVTRDAATPEIGAAAQLIAGSLSQTQANVAFRVKEPVTFGVAGLKIIVPTSGPVRPYVLGGGGLASVKQDVAFTVGGTDVTSNLASQFGVTLGTDLSGTFTKPMVVAGAGAMWMPAARLVLDLQFRFGRIFAEDGGINVSRAGVGLGVRF